MTARFSNRGAQITVSAFGAVILLIGLSMGPSVQMVFYGVLGTLIVLRAWQANSVTVTTDAVVTRSMVRTRTFRLGSVRSVEVRVGRTGPNGFDRQHLVLHFSDGSEYPFHDFNAKPKADQSTVVDRAARLITERLP